MKTLTNILFALVLLVSATQTGVAQDKKVDKKAARAAEVKLLMQSKNYLFKAQYMQPTGGIQLYPNVGNQRCLTSEYDVTVKPDTIVSYLPYFGVVYFNAGYNSPSDAGIKFTSTKFDYRLEEKTNGTYMVYIKPTDTKNTERMMLYVSSAGYASLSVQSNNRQLIRFDGYVDEIPKPKL